MTEDDTQEDRTRPDPLCAACRHQHASDEPCLCPECGQPAVAPGAACGRADCNAR